MNESGRGPMDRVSDQDRQNLNRIGVNTGSQPFQRDMQTEASLMKPNVNLETENNDALKANMFSIKFVGLNTPSSLPPNMESLPKSLYFTFKFYTFQHIQTESASLTTTKVIEDGSLEQGDIELAKKYYLV